MKHNRRLMAGNPRYYEGANEALKEYLDWTSSEFSRWYRELNPRIRAKYDDRFLDILGYKAGSSRKPAPDGQLEDRFQESVIPFCTLVRGRALSSTTRTLIETGKHLQRKQKKSGIAEKKNTPGVH